VASPEGKSDGGEAHVTGRLKANFLFVLGFTIAATLVFALILALLGPISARHGQIPILVMQKVHKNLGVLAKAKGPKHKLTVAFLGDSTVDDYPPGEKVTDFFRKALNREYRLQPPIVVSSLAFSAMGPASYYFLADRIIETKPDLIVWEVSLTHASERWYRALPRPQLAGWMAPERIPATLGMPIEHIGLTADELLFYSLLVQTGQEDTWAEVLKQLSRVDKVRAILEEKASAYVGSRAEYRFFLNLALTNLQNLQLPENAKRYNKQGEIDHFGSVLDGIGRDHPALRFVSESIHLFNDAKIPVLVYLNPINVQHLRNLGLIRPPEFGETLGSFKAAVDESGGIFLDLHQLFPDSHFSDMSGHFRHDDEIQAQAELANKLAKFVVDKKLLDTTAPRPDRGN